MWPFCGQEIVVAIGIAWPGIIATLLYDGPSRAQELADGDKAKAPRLELRDRDPQGLRRVVAAAVGVGDDDRAGSRSLDHLAGNRLG